MNAPLWTDDEAAELSLLVDSGKTIVEAATILGRSEQSCRHKQRRIARDAALLAAGEPLLRAMRPWTEGDIADLMSLRDVEKLTFEAIGERIGRTARCCNHKYRGKTGLDGPSGVKASDTRAPAQQLADRDARMGLQHRDFTAAFFGDPLPGHSALDQRGLA
ncbi:hypothetical protein FNL56_13315 [Tardiphaga sp. vice304]|uniref:hypothetical protein n=1 Tax=Tardiphaga sp. vice304 TaxID=2592817 RepID=UPI001165AC16|nr:hypothetical protein [Tardiphaga sp. vice304]QDM26979.1 hypothetical protein FNL56_13315 [Tardiphaga sp. vice304]